MLLIYGKLLFKVWLWRKTMHTMRKSTTAAVYSNNRGQSKGDRRLLGGIGHAQT